MTASPQPTDGRETLHIVALSGGKDSTALALRLRELNPDVDYTYVCTPTGDELPEMFAHWRNLGELLGKRLTPVMHTTGLKGVCRKEGTLPNFRMRFCTRILKIEPYRKWLAKNTPCVSYVGLRADEEGREALEQIIEVANYGAKKLGEIDPAYVPGKVAGHNQNAIERFWLIVRTAKAALSAPRVEPVAWRWRYRRDEELGRWLYNDDHPGSIKGAELEIEPLYTAPPSQPDAGATARPSLLARRDRCPKCSGELDTGWECNDCGFDAQTLVPPDAGDRG